jgi:hypothetical protein
MMENIDAILNKITNTDQNERSRLIRYSATIPEQTRVRAFQQAVNSLYSSRNREYQHLGKTALLYCGLISALKKIRSADTKGMKRKGSKKIVRTIEELRRDRMDVLRKRKNSRSNKRLRLAKYLGVIWEARNNGYSLQMICDWLLETQQIKVSREYLRKVLKDDAD